MYLIEIFLPLADNHGSSFAPERFDEVRRTLSAKFGGLTAFTRATAQGTEKRRGGERADDLIVFEVMAEDIDERWWHEYRKDLEADFKQDRILIRASGIKLL
jgi:hypothetical protein